MDQQLEALVLQNTLNRQQQREADTPIQNGTLLAVDGRLSSDQLDLCLFRDCRAGLVERRVNSEPRHTPPSQLLALQHSEVAYTKTQLNSTAPTQERNETVNESDMEKLFTKIGAPSYLPTPAEVLGGVRWLRENPAIAAGVVVGLTSYSVAKYYEYGEDSDEENDEDNGESSRATREEIARSVTALHLGLLKIDTTKKNRRHSGASSTSTESSLGSSGGLRSRASSVFDKSYYEELEFQEHAVEQVWSCLHEGQCPSGEKCSDPVWGWFVPAGHPSPTDNS